MVKGPGDPENPIPASDTFELLLNTNIYLEKRLVVGLGGSNKKFDNLWIFRHKNRKIVFFHDEYPEILGNLQAKFFVNQNVTKMTSHKNWTNRLLILRVIF
jgi:hypothetical protein